MPLAAVQMPAPATVAVPLMLKATPLLVLLPLLVLPQVMDGRLPE